MKPAAWKNIFVASCEPTHFLLRAFAASREPNGHTPARRRTRDTPARKHERATAGAWVPEPDRLGCATIVCERPAGNRTTTRQFRLRHRVATGRLAPCRQPWGHTPGCNRGRFWLPLPMSVGPDFRRECGARRSRAPTVTQGKKRSATAPTPARPALVGTDGVGL